MAEAACVASVSTLVLQRPLVVVRIMDRVTGRSDIIRSVVVRTQPLDGGKPVASGGIGSPDAWGG